MIVFEERLAELFDLLPVVTDANSNTYKPMFNWGTQDVLNKYLTLPSQQSKYPLIWLVNGNDLYDTMAKEVRRQNARLVIAMRSDKVDEFNPFIYETDYKMILNPLLENVLTALNGSSISYLYESEYTVKRVPNYSVNDTGEKSGTVDIWNAITLDCSISINDQCLCPIIF